MAERRVRLDGQTRTTVAIFGEEGMVPLLEAYTLEGFGLAPVLALTNDANPAFSKARTASR